MTKDPYIQRQRESHPLSPSPPLLRSRCANAGRGNGQKWQTSPELWEKLKPLARQKRREPTPAEEQLWQKLRNKQLLGLKFRRQHTIERFIVDFYGPEVRLVLEVDGAIHDYTEEEDALRQEFLESLGLQVLRSPNELVLNSPDTVLEQIASQLQNPSISAGRVTP